MWNTEFDFAEKNYNGGSLVVNKDNALLLYLTKEKVELVPVYDENGEYVDSKVKEQWMGDSYQRLNRMAVEVLNGGKGKTDKLVFKEKAQTGQWWQTADLKTIYINTYWLDFTLNRTIPEHERIRKARQYKIFKSIDGGESFVQLKKWPSYRQVTQILFDETGVFGYAIGGQKTLWRTADGGESWVEIKAPQQILNTLKSMSFDQRSDLIFDAYHFDEKTKDFYLSNLMNDHGQYYSVIYKFPWSTDPKENRVDKYEPILTVTDLNITDINSEANKIYMLGMAYDFVRQNYDAVTSQTSFLSAEINNKNTKLIDKVLIDKALQLGSLFLGKDQVLYSSGFRNLESYPYQRDVAAVSFDKGKTWQVDNEGEMIQASSFDPKTNKVYMLKGGHVSSRELTKLNSLLP